jgi:biopolymer transport protein ExbD
MKYLLSSILCCMLFFTCTPEKMPENSRTSLNLEVELYESRVVKLNGKEIHVDLLQDQLESLSRKHAIDVTLKVAGDVPFGIVHDVQRIMNTVGVAVRT